MNKSTGFTLIELMIVVVIIGILASLSMPRFIDTIERARSTEALMHLGALRSSMERYFLENNNSYQGATLENLDIDNPNSPVLYPNRYFNYEEPDIASSDSYTLTGRRINNSSIALSPIAIHPIVLSLP